ncbi:MAG: DUF1743 domain-containing protein [Euryarchaeota archaeon]|nr:DUF1743 domain-containing protein [Euryarchaeota archaeon]
MAHVGVDDTDSRQGLCTTYLATELVREFEDWDLLGWPRLVRLNPNVPWKTRGNGAVYVRFGRGRGEPRVVGELDGRPVRAYPRGDPAPVDDAFEARVRTVIARWSALDDPTTHPGYALLTERPGPRLYWRAVRTIVSLTEALAAGAGRGRIGGFKEGRGRIGALAAVSWRPQDRTYEVLAYRERSRWGTPRSLDEASVLEMDRRFPSTFHNYDYANRRVVLAPHSPCPILCGVRGDDPEVLPTALATLTTEPADRWLLFETNQGTDDHLIPANGGPLVPRTSVTVEGAVAGMPRSLPGGHVVVPIDRGADRVDCTAYEPSKEFRRVVRSLRPGDFVRACGAVRASPRTINLEKLRVVSLVPGRRAIAPGWYEPAVSARRHLAKPLKRFRST